MNRKLVCFCAAVLFLVGFPAASPAAITWWGEIWYGGYVQVQDFATSPDYSIIQVMADTAVVLFNPNPKTIQATMFVYNKKGQEVTKSFFIDGGEKDRAIPPRGWGWLTLGALVRPRGPGSPATKYTFKIVVGSDEKELLEIPKAPVVEVKEVIYEQKCWSSDPNTFWDPSCILRWSETSLGGDNGTGFYWRP